MSIDPNTDSIKLSHTFKAMGGEFQLLCYPQNFLSKDEVKEKFLLAEKEVLRIENKFTDFRSSEFNKINESAGISPVKVDEEIWNLVQRSIEISKDSNGIFDISYASIGQLWREAKARGETVSFTDREKFKQFVDFEKIVFSSKDRTIFLPRKEMKIGLGGIGKGYAVDQIYELLEREGIYNFYVNGSGDIRVHSVKSAPRPWKVGIRNPFSADSGKSVGLIQIHTGSVASSGGYVEKNSNLNSEKVDHHIINPKGGNSGEDLVATTVIADTAIAADTTATILMNMSSKEAIKYLDKLGLIGVGIDYQGKTHLSKRAMKAFGLVV